MAGHGGAVRRRWCRAGASGARRRQRHARLLAETLSFALRYDGWRRVHQADDFTARIAAEQLVSGMGVSACSELGYADGHPILRGRAAPAHLHAHPQAEVWGVLYAISRHALLRLDASEGVPWWRYRPLWLDVGDAAGNRLRAVTYVARGNEMDDRPSLRYITLLREGARAHGLADHYVRFLERIEHA